jgi:hypothetical protein
MFSVLAPVFTEDYNEMATGEAWVLTIVSTAMTFYFMSVPCIGALGLVLARWVLYWRAVLPCGRVWLSVILRYTL